MSGGMTTVKTIGEFLPRDCRRFQDGYRRSESGRSVPVAVDTSRLPLPRRSRSEVTTATTWTASLSELQRGSEVSINFANARLVTGRSRDANSSPDRGFLGERDADTKTLREGRFEPLDLSRFTQIAFRRP